MRNSLIAVAAATLVAACEPPARPVATPLADAGVVNDGFTVDVVAFEAGPVACTPAQTAACDDKDPCTKDECAPGGACSHQPAPDAPCNDFDPCTLADVCTEKGCKGKKNNCDDDSPCTTDICQVDGQCSNKPNQHYDCVPLITVDHPQRGYRWADPKGLLTVTGKLVSQKAKAVALTLQGKAVALGADGAFSAQLQLTPGATRLDFLATDDKGGTRKRFQGVHWAAGWDKGQLPLGAVGLGALLPATWEPAKGDAWAGQWSSALGTASFSVPPGWSGVDAKVLWQVSALPTAMGLPGCAGVVALMGQPAPIAVAPPLAATASLDPGTPDLCPAYNHAGAFANDPKLMQLVLTDRAWNAALQAAWLGGGLAGDVSPITAGLYPIEIAAAGHLSAPWLLQTCGDGGPRLDLVDLRVHLRAPADPSAPAAAEGDVHVTVRVQPLFKFAQGKLQLWIGATASIAADLALQDGVFFSTDIQEGLVAAAVGQAVPDLLAQWAKAPLAELPLPTAAQPAKAPVAWDWAGPQLKVGAVGATAMPK